MMTTIFNFPLSVSRTTASHSCGHMSSIYKPSFSSNTLWSGRGKKPVCQVGLQRKRRTEREKREIFESLNDWAKENVLVYLKPVERSWQPSDFLPDTASDEFHDQVKELRERAEEIPDDYLVVLVGDMITEEALPMYTSMLNRYGGANDESGYGMTPWAIWARGWSAEENRHGDLLSKYLYLSGRVDMLHVEKSIHYLIATGMNINTGNDPYKGFIYTSFQERSTFISHGNTARLAKEYGETNLAQLCGTVAPDEKRHEAAYTKMVEKPFEIDPDGMMIALAGMIRSRITMPAHWIYDGKDENLYGKFSALAEGLGCLRRRTTLTIWIISWRDGKWETWEVCRAKGKWLRIMFAGWGRS